MDLVLSHRTQILYIADISFVIMYLEVVPGCLVLESGTRSGSLTTSLARAVAPTGHVHTFDFHEQRAASARDDFERTGLSSLISVRVRDIQGEGFPNEFAGLADAVFLDLPQPWLAIPSAEKMLKQYVREGKKWKTLMETTMVLMVLLCLARGGNVPTEAMRQTVLYLQIWLDLVAKLEVTQAF
ncbi:hypothetical protein AHAS_Ahas12G0177800 [Arachis hypogaea]